MIPLSVPNISGNEWKYVKECLDTNWVSSVGSYVDRFEESLASYTGAKHAVSTVNGTSALHISLLLAGVEQNDYVIVPNITFVASVNAVTYLKAKPILIDVEQGSWQMDLSLLEEFLQTKAEVRNSQCFLKENGKRIACIMPVHVLGNMCDMNRLMSIAARFQTAVVEDATESLGSYFKGQHSGTFGLFGCLSFNGNKIITTGGGGMILTNDTNLAKKAKHLTTQAKSDPFEYLHDDIGYNYRLVNILAAMGVAQMEQLPAFLAHKKTLSETYKSALIDIPGFKAQEIGTEVIPNNWLQTFAFQEAKALMKFLTEKKIQVRPFWVPMNRLEIFRRELYISANDFSEKIYESCVSLPCSSNLALSEQAKVISAIREFYGYQK
jgi:perosamine synthetase